MLFLYLLHNIFSLLHYYWPGASPAEATRLDTSQPHIDLLLNEKIFSRKHFLRWLVCHLAAATLIFFLLLIMTFTVWYWGIGRQGPGHDCSSLDWNVKRNVVSIKTETPSTSCCCPLLPTLQSPSCLNFSSPFLFLSPHYFGNYTEKWDIDNITSDGVEKIIKAKREKWKS